MKWTIAETDPEAVAALGRTLGVSGPVARVLCARGLRDAEAARRFLKPSTSDLHDPFLLADMRAATARLARAIEQKERILLYGDYDVDGTSALVVLKKVLDLAGGIATCHVPHRIRDGYGMNQQAVEDAAARGVTLIVSVDTGIRANLVVRHAAGLGIDVIVTDHHLPETELPPAVAVVNPNRADCQYPEKTLCGAGVALKLADALLSALGWEGARRERLVDSLLKLVAIATVADVVPLVGENRVIVKRGLEGLRRVTNPGLRALLDVAGVEEGAAPSARQVAFQIRDQIEVGIGRVDPGIVSFGNNGNDKIGHGEFVAAGRQVTAELRSSAPIDPFHIAEMGQAQSRGHPVRLILPAKSEKHLPENRTDECNSISLQ